MSTRAPALLNGSHQQSEPPTSEMPSSNLLAARQAHPKLISEVASDLGLLPDELEPYGRYKAKVRLEVLKRLAGQPQGKYIDVTSITPTPLGEGKSLTTIGLGWPSTG